MNSFTYEFIYEMIHELNFHEFMYLNSLENLWFRKISSAVVAQRSFNLEPLLLLPLQDQ